MFPLAFILPVFIVATFVPVFAALYLLKALRGVPVRYLAAAGIGLSFWYFFDTAADANSLAENNGLYPAYLFGGTYHFLLIGSFLAGAAVLIIFDGFAVPGSGKGPSPAAGLLIPAGVALVMGVHGLGEGWDALSSVASAPSASNLTQALIQAFGTLPAVASYPVHKFLEASVFGVLYAAYSPGRGGALERTWGIPVLGALFAGPSAIGALFGYYSSFDTTYFFAFALMAALYASARLAELLANDFDAKGRLPARFGPKVVVAIALGMLLLYAAALLH